MPFDPNSKDTLETLFAQTARGPFTGYTPFQIAQEASFVDSTPASVAEDTRWPLYLQGYIFSRCYNNSFDSPPPKGDNTTLNELDNKLPGWTFVDDTTDGSGAATWRGSGTTSGRVEFSVADTCSVNDEVYIEQTVYSPFGGIKPFNFYAHLNGYEAASGLTIGTDMEQFIRVRWLYYDGTEDSNAETVYEKGDNEAGHCRQWWSQPPANVVYAKLQIGYRVLATGTLSGTETLGAIYEADFDSPETSYGLLRFAYGEATAHEATALSTTYTMETEGTQTHEAAGKFRAQAPGFIMGLSTGTDSTISAGTVNFRPVIAGTGIDWVGDPTLGAAAHKMGHNVSGTTDYLNYATQGKLLSGDAGYDFLNGDTVQMEMVTDSSWSATAGCWVATMLVMFVWHEIGTASAGESLDSVAYRGG